MTVKLIAKILTYYRSKNLHIQKQYRGLIATKGLILQQYPEFLQSFYIIDEELLIAQVIFLIW